MILPALISLAASTRMGAAGIGIGFVDAAARSLLLATAVGAGLALLRVRNVVAQKAAWMLVLAAAVAMPLLAPLAARLFPSAAIIPTASVSRFLAAGSGAHPSPAATVPVVAPIASAARSRIADIPPERLVAEPPASSGGDHYPAPAITYRDIDSASAAAPVAARAAAPPSRQDRIRTLAGFALVVYVAVCGALLFRMLYGLAAALSLWHDAVPVTLESAAGLRLRSTTRISSPVTIGSGIVLPDEYAQWDAEKLRIVLAHEASHVRQRDFYIQLAASLYFAIFWFSPLGWWLKRKLSDLSETISDRAAVSEAASHISYAQVLLEFAALPRPIPIGVAMANQGRLIPRIERLLNESAFRQAFAGGRARIAAAVLIVPAALFAATALVRVQAAGQQTPPQQAPPAKTADNTITPAAHPVNPPSNLAPPAAEGPSASALPQSSTAPAAPPSAEAIPVPSTAPSVPAPPAGPDSDVFSTVGPSGVVIGPGVAVGPGMQMIGPDGKVITLRNPMTAADRARLRELIQNAKQKMALSSADRANMLALAQVMKTQKMTLSSADRAQMQALVQAAKADRMAMLADGRGNWWNNDGNSYAYVTGEGQKNTHFSGNWYDGSREEIEKARKVAHGDFIWFERDGKSYVIDDQALLAPLKPMQDQMEDLGRQQEELGKQQEDLGKKQEELGRQQEQASVPTPDMSKELAELNKAIDKLNAQKGATVTQEQLADVESKLGDLQGKIGNIEGEIGSKQGEIGAKQGELGAQQGKLGAQQGKLGAQQGRIAREMDGKVLTIIDECMKNGKARQVQ
ncbi:MAG TPA: M56 family metallopeptidase [Terracidiphilus sp.]|nr:M56 family metallopeptidase [Terracidiphilus sp.]